MLGWLGSSPTLTGTKGNSCATRTRGGTFASSINPSGAITGYYSDANAVYHGYVCARNGTITEFDVPGAGTGEGDGTFAIGNNPKGAIAGFFGDANAVYHGYVRAPDGAITQFDAPGVSTGAFLGTFAMGNNPANAIAGYYEDASHVALGFLRFPWRRATTTMPLASPTRTPRKREALKIDQTASVFCRPAVVSTKTHRWRSLSAQPPFKACWL